MLSFFYVIVSLMIVLPDIYIRLVTLRGMSLCWWDLLYWAPLAFIIFLTVLFFAGGSQPFVFKSMVAMILCTVVPKLLFVVVSITGKLCGAAFWWGGATDLTRCHIVHGFDIAGILLAGIFLVSALYGLTAGPRRLVVRHVELSFPDLPKSFDGYRIVHISDLHCSSYAEPGLVERLVDTVNAQHADMIAFTGDLVNSSPDELDGRMMSQLSRLSAKDGVYSVVGNHDYCEYRKYTGRDGAARSFSEVIIRERSMGWNLLLDSTSVITRPSVPPSVPSSISYGSPKTDSLYIIGVEHCGKPPFGSRGDLRKAMAGVPANAFKILLSHDPSHWRAEVLPSSDIQLTLSGHTHAMQFRIGRFSPARWMYPEWYGVYREGDRVLNVTAGIGGSFPFRLGAWPEIQVITLRQSGPA